ncbi:uncharacterized protein LOC127703104 isoform X2 [Mytilus californianus]|uniref:uncharacterized protein LOC127703104 isoform X1 n=2 Tax=Mytilus californianus TaxID=6549 RepID=UPI0022486153|nr:uncharacterized protein LOC127703104 isoform X1 [Mytilus californianus]XP_052063609.1 uncharacterized protein LOC127703104 isoform X2 [Mytilus californianus]
MRGGIKSPTEDLRLDFVGKSEINEDTIILPDIQKRHPRLYKTKRRDHDMADLDDPHIVELMRKGTIPPSLSLRAPPTHIGTTQHRNDTLGISKEEISKRYIIKLHRDRLRNNEAVYKSLDNLPIKIKQVAQDSFEKSSSARKSSPSSFRSRKSSRSIHLQDVRDHKNQTITKSLDSPWNKSKAINPRKQRSKTKLLPRVNGSSESEKSKNEDELKHVSFEPNAFNMLESEMPYIFSAGFQGYQNRVKLSRKRPIAFGQTINTTGSNSNSGININSNQDFQRRYQRVLDADKQPHFVKTSLIKGQRVNNTYNKYKHLFNEAETETERSEELFAIKSVQRINEPFIFTSPASPTRVPNPSLYSECQNSELGINTLTSPPSRAASSTLADVDSRENSSRGDPDNEFTQNDENYNFEPVAYKESDEKSDDTEQRIPTLSLELLRVHESATSAQTKKSIACNLTDITERDESNLTKTTRSEIGPDMKISVKINFKSKEDVIEESNSIISVSSKRSKDSLTPRQPRHNASSESKRTASSLSETPLDTIRVEGRLFGEHSDMEKRRSNCEPVKNTVSTERSDHSSVDEEKEIPQIIVDLNTLKTVKTPIKKNRSDIRSSNEEKKDHKHNKTYSEKNNVRHTDVSPSEDNNGFFLTYEDEHDSALSHYEESSKIEELRDFNCNKDTTPRTEVDDSGISISTFENETIKC